MDIKKIPVGQDDFRSLIEDDYYFVDKSLLIKDLINYNGLVNFITRPRRFGKSLNMSMLQYFFEAGQDYAYLFKGLNISHEKELCDKYMGLYPVISLTFMNAKFDDFDQALSAIKYELSNEFWRHIDAVNAYPGRRNRINAILNLEDDETAKYESSLHFLSEILKSYYNQKVIILIDEYDIPLESAYMSDYYMPMRNFIRGLLRFALKSNKNLHFAVLTGCLRISKESVFTGLNNFSVASPLNNTYAQYFGFLENEVIEYLEYYGLKDKLPELKEWYDGYQIGKYEVYNPWSVTKQIMSYLMDQAPPVSHWGNTSSNDIVKEFIARAQINTKSEIEELLAGKTIMKPISEDMTYTEIYNTTDNLWSFLFYTGYLTADKIDIHNGIYSAALRIPNKEIEYIFLNKIMDWFQDIAEKEFNMINLLLDKNSIDLQESLNKLLFGTISYMDYNERYYHGIMIGLLSYIDSYKLLSNRESGLGRADITLENEKTAIIFELKVVNSTASLEQACDTALSQINMQAYEKEFPNRNIIKVGIAFFKKSCSVKII